jgi:hypothetical protein
VRTAVVTLVLAIAVFVALPEALGDRPYDPRPSRVLKRTPTGSESGKPELGRAAASEVPTPAAS